MTLTRASALLCLGAVLMAQATAIEEASTSEALALDENCHVGAGAVGDPVACELSLRQLRARGQRLEAEVELEPASGKPQSGPKRLGATTTDPRRLRVINGCPTAPMWIAHMAAASTGPDPQSIRIEPGGVYEFSTPSHLMATRYWPKMGCDAQGHNCSLGDSGGPEQACVRNPVTGDYDYSRCSPPVDTKFEASFGQNGEPCNPRAEGGTQMRGCDFVDLSLVDGWTLPVKFEASGECMTNRDERVEVIDCSGLSLDACPAEEVLTAAGMTVDLRAINPITNRVAGCYSPCSKLLDTKWSNRELAVGRLAEAPGVAPYCCPTPPLSPEACRAGPITTTNFLNAVHTRCPGVYGYAYDDGMGLMRCSSATIYTVTFYCPAEVVVRVPI